MTLAQALSVLERMRRKMEIGKPAWYESAAEEVKLDFDTWNNQKIEAIACAIKCVKSSEKLRKAQESIEEYLSEINGD